ncbi:hypothetical protein GALL_536090 [mine drainage metagenome]|uniref:Uncharacterized protein n=1 Tax=mine drainage metagenome TaxID=410659 RepID=A0A1J5P2F5_9ZZZZ
MALNISQVDNDMNVRVGEHGFVVGVGTKIIGGCDDVAPRRIAIGDACNGQAGVPCPSRHIMVENIAAADDTDGHYVFLITQLARAASIKSAMARLSLSGIALHSVAPARTAAMTASAS